MLTELINLLCLTLGAQTCGRKSSWSVEHKKRAVALLTLSGIRLVLCLLHGSDQFSLYFQDYCVCIKDFKNKDIGGFIRMRMEISVKQNNEKRLNE